MFLVQICFNKGIYLCIILSLFYIHQSHYGGNVTIADQHHIIFAGTVGGGAGRYIAGSDNLYVAANRSGEKIFLESTYQDAPYFRCSSGDYKIIHAGNISSQSVNYATSAGSAGSATYCNYVVPSYYYSGNTISDSTTPESLSKHYNGSLYPAFHYTDWGWSDTLLWSGYDKWGMTELATQYNARNNCRLKIRKFNQSVNTWGDWTEIITSGNIGSQSVNYASSAGSVSWSNVTGRPFENSGYFLQSSAWDWNPFNASTRQWVAGWSFRHSNSSDTGDLRFYLSTNPPGCGGQGICMNIDGYIATLSQIYAGNGMYVGSDRNLKKAIQNIPESSLDELFSVSDKLLKKFTLKSSNRDSYGFIAQQLEKYIPEAVTQGSDGVKSVSYDIAFSKIIAALIHKIRDLEKKVS